MTGGPNLLGGFVGRIVLAHSDFPSLHVANHTQRPLLHTRLTIAGSLLHRQGGPLAQSPHSTIV
jgi:hypothetical protein